MSIGGISAMESKSAHSMKQESVDAISKNIENEISVIQRQRQQVSKEDLSADEKMKKRQELQQEISRLNTRLRQRQAETRREKDKETQIGNSDVQTGDTKASDDKKTRGNGEVKGSEKETDDNSKKTENKAIDMQDKKSQSQENTVVSAANAIELSTRQNSVISGIRNDIRLRKGEIKQDKARGENVEDKEKALDKSRNRLRRAASSEYIDSTGKNGQKAVGAANTNYSKEKKHVERQNFNISFN